MFDLVATTFLAPHPHSKLQKVGPSKHLDSSGCCSHLGPFETIGRTSQCPEGLQKTRNALGVGSALHKVQGRSHHQFDWIRGGFGSGGSFPAHNVQCFFFLQLRLL